MLVLDDLHCDPIYFGADLFLEGFFLAFRLASAARFSFSYWDMVLGYSRTFGEKARTFFLFAMLPC